MAHNKARIILEWELMGNTTLQVLTDAHIATSAEGYGSERKLCGLAKPVLSEILRQGIERGDVHGVLDLGDLIEHAGSDASIGHRAAVDQANFRNSLQLFDQLQVPHLHAIGNHPLMNLSEKVVMDLLRLDQPYYSRDIGEHKVVMLHSRFKHLRDSADFKSGSGIFIDEQQIAWLREELAKSEKPVLICSHHPLSDQDLTGSHWFEKFPQCALMENGEQVRAVLGEHAEKVVAVMNGHTHWNHLTQDSNGIAHITLQSLSENFRGDGTPASTYGIALLKDAFFNLEIFGNDLSLKNETPSSQQIAQDLAATYDSVAQSYAEKTAQFGAAEHEQILKMEGMLRPDHSKLIVDFGCGPGRDVPFYVDRGFDVIGVDVSGELLKIAKAASPNQKFIQSDFATVDIKANSAAIVIHSSTLQHVPKESLERVLRKSFETLEPGGIFYAHYRSGEGESLSVSTEYGVPIARFIALYTETEMEAALRKVGFEIIESNTFDHKYEGIKGQTVKYKTRTFARKPLNT